MSAPTNRRETVARIRREITDARTQSNRRSMAIASAVIRSAKDARREAVMAKCKEFIALTEHAPSAQELQAAREVLAENPTAPQGRLFTRRA